MGGQKPGRKMYVLVARDGAPQDFATASEPHGAGDGHEHRQGDDGAPGGRSPEASPVTGTAAPVGATGTPFDTTNVPTLDGGHAGHGRVDLPLTSPPRPRTRPAPESPMPYIASHDDTDLYVKDWGTGRPVVMLHGWPLSADTFDDLGMAIADAGMRAIAYDRRGFGRSDQPWEGYDYDTLADDLAAVMEAVEAQDATLIGFSMGGGEVARYMSRHRGANVAQAVLISSVVPYMLLDRRQSRTASTPRRSKPWRRACRPTAPILDRLLQGLLRRRPGGAAGERRGDRVVVRGGDAGQSQGHPRLRGCVRHH